MDATALALLIEEIAPTVAGARVGDAWTDESTGALVLALAGTGRRALTISADPPGVIFVSPASPGRRSSEGALERELRGATIVELAPGPRPSSARVVFSRTDDIGETATRALAVELGRRPGLSLVGAGAGAGAAQAGAATAGEPPSSHATPDAAGPPTVHWRRDPQGRLHVKLSVGRPTAPCDGSREFPSFNDAAAHVYAEFARPIALERRRRRLAKRVRIELDRKLRAVEKVQAEIAESARAGEYRRHGQLLLARKDAVRKGDPVARVLDYDNATVVEIPLNPALSPAQNAEVLFRRAKRAERRAAKAPARLSQLAPEAERAGALLAEVERADEAALASIEARLAPPPREAAPRTADGERARFRTYTVTGGWQVLVGKSNRDNDALTHKVARPGDLWFHARQAAGSHVVLRKAGTGREPDRAAILEAAAIAAYHSKAGRSGRVAVCYTEARHVRKPRGAAPGLAVVSREKVVMVQPRLPEE